MGASGPADSERRFDAGGPTLAETGEAELLSRLTEIAAAAPAPGVRLGSGDDGAVWRPEPGNELVVSQDALVEGRDFRRAWITPRQLGRRAFTAAVSDLAGMGAMPAWCMATLCAPASTCEQDILEIQRGLCAAAAAAGCAVVGGDLSDIDGPLVVDICVGGTVPEGRYLRRDTGRPGDALLVTGTLGRAAAGLRLLLDGVVAARPADRELWRSAALAPAARIAEGRRLVELGVRCGGDISDGLLAEAGRTARASGCAAELWLERLPVDASLPSVFGESWPELAVGGGEEFELLAAVQADRAASLAEAWDALTPLSVVGRLHAGAGVRLLQREGGAELPLPRVGSRHFG